MSKPWWKSKTKWGSLLLALAQAAPAVVAAVATGDWAAAVPALVQAVGLAVGGFGVRDALEPARTNEEVARWRSGPVGEWR